MLVDVAATDAQDFLDDYVAAQIHGGLLTVAELRRHPNFRGPEFVRLGEMLARDGFLDPGIIGAASRSGEYDQQHLKRIWHYVACFGARWD